MVTEDEIAFAIGWLLNHHHLVVEGSGAVGAALILSAVGAIPNRSIVTDAASASAVTAAGYQRLTATGRPVHELLTGRTAVVLSGGNIDLDRLFRCSQSFAGLSLPN